MRQSLAKAGLTIIQAGDITGDVLVDKNDSHREFPDKNHFINKTGRTFMKTMQVLPNSTVRETDTINVIIASK